jgi:O-antigen ligase
MMTREDDAGEATGARFGLAVATLVAAVVLGGGQGTPGDGAVQLLSLALVGLLVLRAWRRPGPALPLWTWIPVAAVVAIPLLQLLPLPESLWVASGGRAELAAQLRTAGVEPAARWGLNPIASERALYWLLPAIALYLAVLRLPGADRQRLRRLLPWLGVASVALGVAQVAGGGDSPLRFYSRTNETGAVGFFANRNHLATLLALCLPLVVAEIALAAGAVRDARGMRWRLGTAVGAGLALLLGLALTHSRAGLALGMLAIALTATLAWPALPKGGSHRLALGALALAGLLVLQGALFAVMQRIGSDPLADERVAFARNTWAAAQAYAPLGSGLGTFRQAYQPFEAADPRGPASAIVNHAHNDLLELWLEAGWILLPVAAVLVGVLAMAAWRGLHRAESPAARLLHQAVAIAAAVPLLHSLVDYPLRTSAHLAVLGLLAGLLVAPAARATRRAPASRSPGGIGYTGG